MEAITRKPFAFTSADGVSTIHATLWLPEGDPKGIVQLVHGMSEHIARYDDFACFLASNGFAVVGHDQIGHGNSAAPGQRGHIPLKGGKASLLADIHQVRMLTIARACDYFGIEHDALIAGSPLPYFLFGHSMGSFEVRVYISHYGEGLAGAIICGTGFIPPVTSAMGHQATRLISRVKGEDSRSKLLHSMGVGAFAKEVENPQTPLDWLSYNHANVEAYIADEMCGAAFSAGGYAAVTSLTGECCQPGCVNKVPKGLPLFYVSGKDDPVGDMGVGVLKAFEMAKAAGIKDITCKIYTDMRHEILNETEHQKVYDDLLVWMEERL